MRQERLILAAGRVPPRTTPFHTYVPGVQLTSGAKNMCGTYLAGGGLGKAEGKEKFSKTCGGIGRCQLPDPRGHLMLFCPMKCPLK